MKLYRDAISKDEVGQMENHCGWFEYEYGSSANVVYLLIHPSNKVSKSANFTHDVRVMTPSKLNEFKSQIDAFVKGLARYEIKDLKESTINEILNVNRLDYDSLRKKYSVEIVTG